MSVGHQMNKDYAMSGRDLVQELMTRLGCAQLYTRTAEMRLQHPEGQNNNPDFPIETLEDFVMQLDVPG